MRAFLRDNSLSLVTLGLFVAFLVAQAITGYRVHNDDARMHGRPTDSFGAYLRSGDFLEATAENWESEFLQMAAFAVLTVRLKQRGSSESKKPEGGDEVDREPDPRRKRAPSVVRRGGLALSVYSHSLSLVLAGLFAMAFVLHAIGGTRAFNDELREHGRRAMTVGEYLATSRFWFQSFQNWQSEFLAVGALVVLSIFLREKGSPQSKPVDAPHAETG
jgi:hypothetical protein